MGGACCRLPRSIHLYLFFGRICVGWRCDGAASFGKCAKISILMVDVRLEVVQFVHMSKEGACGYLLQGPGVFHWTLNLEKAVRSPPSESRPFLSLLIQSELGIRTKARPQPPQRGSGPWPGGVFWILCVGGGDQTLGVQPGRYSFRRRASAAGSSRILPVSGFRCRVCPVR